MDPLINVRLAAFAIEVLALIPCLYAVLTAIACGYRHCRTESRREEDANPAVLPQSVRPEGAEIWSFATSGHPLRRGTPRASSCALR